MKIKTNKSLQQLKQLSMKANEMKAIKGGTLTWSPSGTSKPIRPTSFSASATYSWAG